MAAVSLEKIFDFYRAGRIEAATSACLALLAEDPANAEANHLIGMIAYQQGRNEAARDFIQRAVQCPRATAEMFINLGSVLNVLGDAEAAARTYQRALDLKTDCVEALNNLGVIHRNAGRIEMAIETLRRALQIDPNHTWVKANLEATCRDAVPDWHFAMMCDTERNDAYEAAINRSASGKTVLEIGTGAGLLSLMAARAGAEYVVGCESVSVIAEHARAILKRNGYAGRARIINKRSQDLVLGTDLPKRAALLITETFSSPLFTEGVLPAVEHARKHLLEDGATIIPRAGSAMGYLVGGDHLKDILFVDRVSGFDLSPFDELAPTSKLLTLDRVPHEVLSDDVELARFDLCGGDFPDRRGERQLQVKVTRAGVCLGIAQWIRLELDTVTNYENRPHPDAPLTGHWPHVVYRFRKPRSVSPGDVLNVLVRHSHARIGVELAEEASPF